MAIRSLKTGSFSRSTQVGNQVIMPGSYESIATVTSNGSSGTVTFSSIPSTYQHLQIRITGGISYSSNAYDAIAIQFNSDTTGSNYNEHYLATNGSTPYAGNYTTVRNTAAWLIQSNTSILSSSIIDILDYKDTNKYTTCRSLSGFEWNAGGGVFLNSTVWINTAAVSSISLVSSSGAFITNSSFALYGVK
jgi:hypothetical protein